MLRVPTDPMPMRRWLLILLLTIYPFQVTLAMVDRCCLATQGGITHHAATGVQASADDGANGVDPHCPACVFGHTVTIASMTLDLPRPHAVAQAAALPLPSFASRPRARPERPKWLRA